MKRQLDLAVGVIFALSMANSSCDWKRRESVAEKPHATSQAAPTRLSTSKAELEHILVPGLGTNAMIALLGKPESVKTLYENTQFWNYRLQPFIEATNADRSYVMYAIGVNARVTNGRLAYWGFESASFPIVGHSPTHELDSTTNLAISSGLHFYIVSPEAIAGGTYVNTEGFPNLGFIHGSPVLTVHTVNKLTVEQQTSVDSASSTNAHWVIAIELANEDAMKFSAITRANLSKKLLLAIGRQPVLCATITFPIESGTFEIDCKDTNVLETIRMHLRSEKQADQ